MSKFFDHGHCESRCYIGTKQSLFKLLRRSAPRNDRVSRIMFLMFGVLIVSSVLAQNDFSPPAVFYRGNLQYKDGSYKEAITSYESIRDNGFESGPLYYNLGNSYFKDGRLGKAVLNYERARRLMPRDGDLKSNYDFAILQTKNYVLEDKPFLQNLISRYNNFFTKDEMAISLLVIYLFLGVGLLLRIYWDSARRILTPILVVSGIVLISQTVLFGFKVNSERHFAIVLQNTEAKFEPTLKATSYFPLSEGQKVIILDKEVGYVKIKRPDGKLGWVPAEAIEKI